jgi:hypothetical protein
MSVCKVVSGGQTGVDRAALDVALELNLACGGWCPRGRRAEDGPLDLRYPLCETHSTHYACRTRWNVRDSDGTLILARGALAGGTALTHSIARQLGKPSLVVNPDCRADVLRSREWLSLQDVRSVNIAGPRSSHEPTIYESASRFLAEVLMCAADRVGLTD